MSGIEDIKHENTLYAKIIRKSLPFEGVEFVTPPDLTQQVGLMRHPSGYVISPHVHNKVPRSIDYTNEVLILRKGKLRVDFYTNEKEYIGSRVLEGGDIILLSRGAHGFEVLEDLDMVEVKQGPYCFEADKVRFDGISKGEVFEYPTLSPVE